MGGGRPATESEVAPDVTGPPLARLADAAEELRRIPESRLRRITAPTRKLVQALADAAAGIDARGAAAPPRPRPVPELNVFALGDQVAVVARDLRDAVAGLDAAESVWWHGSRHPLTDVLSALESDLDGLSAQW